MSEEPEFIPMSEDELLLMKADLVNDQNPPPLERQIHFYKSLLWWNRKKYGDATAKRSADAAAKAGRREKRPVPEVGDLLDLL